MRKLMKKQLDRNYRFYWGIMQQHIYYYKPYQMYKFDVAIKHRSCNNSLNLQLLTRGQPKQTLTITP